MPESGICAETHPLDPEQSTPKNKNRSTTSRFNFKMANFKMANFKMANFKMPNFKKPNFKTLCLAYFFVAIVPVACYGLYNYSKKSKMMVISQLNSDTMSDQQKKEAYVTQMLIIYYILVAFPFVICIVIWSPPLAVVYGWLKKIARHIDDRDYYKYNNASTAMRIEKEKQLEQRKMSDEMESKRYSKLSDALKKRDDDAKSRREQRRKTNRSWMDEKLMREARYIHPIDDFNATAKEKRDVKFIKTAIKPTADAYELHHDVDAEQYLQIALMLFLVLFLLSFARVLSTPAFMDD